MRRLYVSERVLSAIAADDFKSGVSGVNDVLWASGAVFYARTTMPQTGMHLETSSNIYGTTLNPHNLSLTPGGSSGGEAALVALRGSVLVRSLFHVTSHVVKILINSEGCWRRQWRIDSSPSWMHWHIWV